MAASLEFAHKLFDAAQRMRTKLARLYDKEGHFADYFLSEGNFVRHFLSEGPFVPVLPVFDLSRAAASNASETRGIASPQQEHAYQSRVCEGSRCHAPLLRPEDAAQLLSWHREQLQRTLRLPQNEAAERRLMLGLGNIKQTALAYSDGIGYIEQMVRDQLIAAIGKEVRSSDLQEFMTHHHKRLFGAEYSPRQPTPDAETDPCFATASSTLVTRCSKHTPTSRLFML